MTKKDFLLTCLFILMVFAVACMLWEAWGFLGAWFAFSVAAIALYYPESQSERQGEAVFLLLFAGPIGFIPILDGTLGLRRSQP